MRAPSSSAAATLALLAACASLSAAAELKVDINNSGRPLREGLDPAFTPWSIAQNWLAPGTGDTSADGSQTSATFGDLRVTLSRVGPVGTGLQSGYWKAGVQNAEHNLKLTADGLKIADGEAGAQLEMRIAGLAPGPHTLLLHLNSWDDTPSAAPLDIFITGTRAIDDLPVSSRATDNTRATTAFLKLHAEADREVVVLIRAETGGDAKSRNIHLNGFEIDTPNPKTRAHSPVPAHADEHVDADSASLTLRWSAAPLGATSHQVYLGTDAAAVRAATPEAPEFLGSTTGTTHTVSGLRGHLTYFWRVDSVAADGAVTPGEIWTFRPRQLAFPGAEGHGRFARGGRGGVVVHVSNLDDSGPGSFRDAIEGEHGDAPRTIVFDVGGLITLQSDIVIGGNQSKITIAGQTAPGSGVCIKRQMFGLSGARDVQVRFLRIFPGKESGETQNATGMAGVDHCIMDHCSFGWALDEAFSSRGAKNLTLQRSLIAEMLNVAGHNKYPAGSAHGYAATIGGDVGSFHHNLLVHNEGRNWSMAGGLSGDGNYTGRLDIFNNVVYNWGGRTTDGGAHEVNFVNNYYKPGPATRIFTVLNPQYGAFGGTQRYHMAGNVLPGRLDARDQAPGRKLGTERGGVLPENSKPPYEAWSDTPFFPSHATIHGAVAAYKQVLSDVGCNQPAPDTHDLRRIQETLTGATTHKGSVSGKPGLPDTTDDVGGWADYGHEVRPPDWDTDRDGLPDWWERIRGLDPASAAGDFTDSNADPDGDGFTHLEDYLNWMAGPKAECAAGESVVIDLNELSRGYTDQPVFTVTNAGGGRVKLERGHLARFAAPATPGEALGGFSFTVTDAAGDTMTRRVGLRIRPR